MTSMQKGTVDDMKSEMDRRGFTSTECNANKITESIASLGEITARMGSVCTT